MRRFTLIVLVTFLAIPAAAEDATAQRDGRDYGDNPVVTFELFGGAADYGTFLEQATFQGAMIMDDMIVITERAERELTGETEFTVGGSVGIWPWDRTAVRLGYTYSPTQLEFDDDTGTGSDFLDTSEIADLTTHVLSLDAMRYLLDPTEHRFAPYANAGFALTWWDLDADEALADGPIVAEDGTEMRFGGVGGLGLQIGLTDRLAARLEASTFGLGNPFDGDEAFRVEDPAFFTFDEPSTVRMSRFTIALTYSILDDRPLLGSR